jgi:histidinol dehydrogenase
LSSLPLRFTGRLSALDASSRLRLFNRSVSADALVVTTVRAIIDRVRREGDSALFDLARDLDGVNLDELEVLHSALQASLSAIPAKLRTAMLRSARNIEAVHAASRPTEISVEVEPGLTVTRRPDPLARVGIYAPGGTAAYASSVLMAAVPARAAGVAEIILCSPPSPSGLPAPEVLAAAAIAGVGRVFTLGGAGAIAAMALGTATVPKVDKVVGPGNAFVAEAKLQLVSEVGIDCPAGPSELVIIADDSATPEVVAREVMAQAEHDTRAIVLVLAMGEPIAAHVTAAIECALTSQPRREIIAEALRNRGGILVVDTEDEAVQASNDFAPEHLLIATRDPGRIAANVRSTGAVFVGETASVAFGDYMTGANHVLPTGGMGRAYSGLSTLDFIRWTTTQVVSRAAAAKLSTDTAAFADAEGLPAHALAARFWREA